MIYDQSSQRWSTHTLKTHSIYDGDGRLITDDVRSNFETRLKIVNASNRYNQSNAWLCEIDNTLLNVDKRRSIFDQSSSHVQIYDLSKTMYDPLFRKIIQHVQEQRRSKIWSRFWTIPDTSTRLRQAWRGPCIGGCLPVCHAGIVYRMRPVWQLPAPPVWPDRATGWAQNRAVWGPPLGSSTGPADGFRTSKKVHFGTVWDLFWRCFDGVGRPVGGPAGGLKTQFYPLCTLQKCSKSRKSPLFLQNQGFSLQKWDFEGKSTISDQKTRFFPPNFVFFDPQKRPWELKNPPIWEKTPLFGKTRFLGVFSVWENPRHRGRCQKKPPCLGKCSIANTGVFRPPIISVFGFFSVGDGCAGGFHFHHFRHFFAKRVKTPGTAAEKKIPNQKSSIPPRKTDFVAPKHGSF